LVNRCRDKRLGTLKAIEGLALPLASPRMVIALVMHSPVPVPARVRVVGLPPDAWSVLTGSKDDVDPARSTNDPQEQAESSAFVLGRDRVLTHVLRRRLFPRTSAFAERRRSPAAARAIEGSEAGVR